MADNEGWEAEVKISPSLIASCQHLMYGNTCMGVMASKHPDVLSSMNAKHHGSDWSKVASCYLAILKATRKLLCTIKSSKSEIHDHLAQDPLVALEMGINPRAAPCTDLVLAPAPRRPGRTRIVVAPALSPSEITASLSAQEQLAAINKANPTWFYFVHVKFASRLVWLIIKYLPIMALYGFIVLLVFAAFVLGSNPDLIVDALAFALSWAPDYIGFVIRRVVSRAAWRFGAAMMPGVSTNSTLPIELQASDSAVGIVVPLIMMWMAVLWRAPQAV